MRIRVDHATTYTYERTQRFIIQMLRLTPRSGDHQHVCRWTVETDVDTRLRRSEDAFGNIVHALYTEKPTDSLMVRVTGEVMTNDTGGVVRGVPEPHAPIVFLRETALTACDKAIGAFVAGIRGGSTLDRLHGLMSAIHAAMEFDVSATTATHTAAEAFELRRGVCQDYAHLFIAAARRMDIPARYVSGHLVRADGQHDQDAAHAWAEAFVEDLGWVGFDAANGICPTDAYVRVAVGLDYLGAAPVRGASYGGGAERLDVKLNVRDLNLKAAQQSQQQA